MRKIFRDLITIEEAMKKIIDNYDLKPIGEEEVTLFEALGRVLSRDIYSPRDIPPFDRSLVDGYAVIASDTYTASERKPVKLKIIERIRTGKFPKNEIKKGLAAEIDTGGVIPKGANAVVPIEFTTEENSNVLIYKRVPPGSSIQYTGTDISAGQPLLLEGYYLTPIDIGLLAAVGIDRIKVYKKPKVAILSIGDELVPPGSKISIGQIYDINTYTLFNFVKEIGCEPISIGISQDSEEEILKHLEKALTLADIIITSGSSSAGYSDMMYRIINKLGKPGVIVHGIKSKPGKPVIIAIVKNKLIFGLPGFPTSALTAFRNLIVPILLRLSGLNPRTKQLSIKARIHQRLFGVKGRRVFLSGTLVKTSKGTFNVYPNLRGSGAITTLANSDGFLEIPEDTEFLDTGSIVNFKLFGDKLVHPDLVIAGNPTNIVHLISKEISQENPNFRIRLVRANPLAALESVINETSHIGMINMIDRDTGIFNKNLVEKYGNKEVRIIAGFSREIGFVSMDNQMLPKKIGDILDKRMSIAIRERGSGEYEFFLYKLKQFAKDKNINFNTLFEKIAENLVELHSSSSILNAVRQGNADIGLIQKEFVSKSDFLYVPLGLEELDLIVNKNSINSENFQLFYKILKSPAFRNKVTKSLGIFLKPNFGEFF